MKIKKLFFCLIICTLTFLGSAQTNNGYVDLGLPSGTLWKNQNEQGLYDYDKAIRTFGNKLPTLKQWEELFDECVWMWKENGYKVIGPNHNSIMLMVSGGVRSCDGVISDAGSLSIYWSSSSKDSEYAWGLAIGPYLEEQLGQSQKRYLLYNVRCAGQSIRLVQSK